MYISIRDDIVFAAGYDDLATGLKDLGIDAVELFVHSDGTVHAIDKSAGSDRLCLDNESQLSALQSQAAAAGITISALCMGTNFNAPDRQFQIDWTIRTVQAAEALGVVAVRLDPIMSGEQHMPIEERQDIVSTCLRAILAATVESGVDLGIENHGYQGNDPEFLTGLLALVDSSRMGLTLDSGNFYWRGWPLSRVYKIFEQFAGVVKHTHIKNIKYPAEIRETQREIGFEYGRYVSPIHEGDIDHARYIRTLKAAGYDRDICLEDESLGKYSEEQRKANLRDAATFFRAHI